MNHRDLTQRICCFPCSHIWLAFLPPFFHFALLSWSLLLFSLLLGCLCGGCLRGRGVVLAVVALFLWSWRCSCGRGIVLAVVGLFLRSWRCSCGRGVVLAVDALHSLAVVHSRFLPSMMLSLLIVAGIAGCCGRYFLSRFVMVATVMVLVDCCGHCGCSSFLLLGVGCGGRCWLLSVAFLFVFFVAVCLCFWLPFVCVFGCRGLCLWLPRFVLLVAAVCVFGCRGLCRCLPRFVSLLAAVCVVFLRLHGWLLSLVAVVALLVPCCIVGLVPAVPSLFPVVPTLFPAVPTLFPAVPSSLLPTLLLAFNSVPADTLFPTPCATPSARHMTNLHTIYSKIINLYNLLFRRPKISNR